MDLFSQMDLHAKLLLCGTDFYFMLKCHKTIDFTYRLEISYFLIDRARRVVLTNKMGPSIPEKD